MDKEVETDAVPMADTGAITGAAGDADVDEITEVTGALPEIEGASFRFADKLDASTLSSVPFTPPSSTTGGCGANLFFLRVVLILVAVGSSEWTTGGVGALRFPLTWIVGFLSGVVSLEVRLCDRRGNCKDADPPVLGSPSVL